MIRMLALPLFVLSSTPTWARVPIQVPLAPHGEYLLKVMSYNVKGLPLPWLKHKYRYTDIAREIGKMRQKGLGPEILGLQEAFIKKTKAICDGVGLKFRARGPGAKGIRINSGIEVASDHPILATRSVLYSKCQGTDCLARKGAVFARIQVPGLPVPIDFYNTHMNANDSGEKARIKQVKEHLQLIKETHRPGNILITLGDFNFRPEGPDYKSYQQSLELINAAYTCGVMADCKGEEDPYREWEEAIDHVFHKDTQDIEVRPVHYEQALSDHTNGKRWSDHEAIIVHYLIRW